MAYKSATFTHYSSSQSQPREGGKGQQPSLVNPCYRIIRLNCYRMVDNYFWLLFETHASLAIAAKQYYFVCKKNI